jgi:hypothetical protein
MSASSACAPSGSIWDQQPQTHTTAPGWRRFARRIACRDFLPLSAVTAQVLMITASQRWPGSAGSWPRPPAWPQLLDSYWFTLQPSVSM